MSYSIALGPFHPAWLGPQRFVLRIADDRVADVEYQSGFNERGCAARLPRLALPEAQQLVARVCGECSFAHSLAFCQALEALCGLEANERARMLRVAIAELERAASHLRAAAAVLQAVGMDGRAAALDEFRAQCRSGLAALSGGRIAAPVCVPGGLSRDVSQADRESWLVGLPEASAALYRFVDQLIDQRLLLARTIEVGALPRAAAEQFGVRGPLARASGIPRDMRADHPYAAYEALGFRAIVQEGGDVYARLLLLLLEAYESLKLATSALQRLPDERCVVEPPRDIPRGRATATVEGPRGAIRYAIESDGMRLTQAQIDAPRQFDRLLARTLLSGAQVDNVMAIIASTDMCVACAER